MVRKVLFVDDDEILRLAVERRFANFKDMFTIVTARDGFDAVKTLANISVSMVVFDLIMPRMDGMSLLGHIRENYPDLPVIVVSSVEGEQMRGLAHSHAVDGYFVKPFLADELAGTILQILQKEADGGTMVDVSPTVFLQLMEMDGKSCTIRIFDRKSGDGGVLYFLDGELLDARIGKLQGLEAARRVFTWDHATVYMHNSCEPRENTINSGLQSIIMEAVTLKDEAEDEGEYSGEMIASLSDGEGGKTSAPFQGWGERLEGVCNVTCLKQDTSLEQLQGKFDQLGRDLGLGEFLAATVDNRQILLAEEEDLILLEVEDVAEHDELVQRLRRECDKS